MYVFNIMVLEASDMINPYVLTIWSLLIGNQLRDKLLIIILRYSKAKHVENNIIMRIAEISRPIFSKNNANRFPTLPTCDQKAKSIFKEPYKDCGNPRIFHNCSVPKNIVNCRQHEFVIFRKNILRFYVQPLS